MSEQLTVTMLKQINSIKCIIDYVTENKESIIRPFDKTTNEIHIVIPIIFFKNVKIDGFLHPLEYSTMANRIVFCIYNFIKSATKKENISIGKYHFNGCFLTHVNRLDFCSSISIYLTFDLFTIN